LAAPARLVDKKLLESTLNLGNRAWGDPAWLLWLGDGAGSDRGWLLGVCGSRCLGSSCGCRRPSWLLLNNGADGAWLLVLDSGRLRSNRRLIIDSDLETELELRLGSSIELLIDRCVGRIEGNEGSGTIGVTLEDSFGRRWDSKEESKLAWQSCCREISERELVSTVDALNVDLDGDEGVKICR